MTEKTTLTQDQIDLLLEGVLRASAFNLVTTKRVNGNRSGCLPNAAPDSGTSQRQGAASRTGHDTPHFKEKT